MSSKDRLLRVVRLARRQRVAPPDEDTGFFEVGARRTGGSQGYEAGYPAWAGQGEAVAAGPLVVGTLVELVEELAGVQSPDGEQVLREQLGPGLVEEVVSGEGVRVHWTRAGLDSWAEPGDLHSLGPRAKMIEVYKRDDGGNTRFLRRRVVSTEGLDRNWTVELLPKNLVRTVRSDGACWTFKYNWIFERVEVWWPQPPDDEDAEALRVAELAVL